MRWPVHSQSVRELRGGVRELGSGGPGAGDQRGPGGLGSPRCAGFEAALAGAVALVMSSDGRTTLDPPNHQQRMQAQSTERAHGEFESRKMFLLSSFTLDVVAAAAADAAAAAAADEQQNVSLMAQTLNADGTPKRPMNAFMIFARKRRPQVSAQNQLLRTGEISKILSREWNTMVIVRGRVRVRPLDYAQSSSSTRSSSTSTSPNV